MSRTFKKKPNNERHKKSKQEGFKKQSLKRPMDYSRNEDEND